MGARVFVVALLGVMILTAVGCGGGDGNQGDGISLTFWTAEDNPDRVKATQAIVDRFQQQTDSQHQGQAGGDQRGPTLIPGRPAPAPPVRCQTCSERCRSASRMPRRPTASRTLTRQLTSSTRWVLRPSPGVGSALWSQAVGRWLSRVTAGPSYWSTAGTCSTGPDWPRPPPSRRSGPRP